MNRCGAIPSGPSSADGPAVIGLAHETTTPLRISPAARARRASVMWLTVPRLSPGPHRPQLLSRVK